MLGLNAASDDLIIHDLCIPNDIRSEAVVNFFGRRLRPWNRCHLWLLLIEVALCKLLALQHLESIRVEALPHGWTSLPARIILLLQVIPCGHGPSVSVDRLVLVLLAIGRRCQRGHVVVVDCLRWTWQKLGRQGIILLLVDQVCLMLLLHGGFELPLVAALELTFERGEHFTDLLPAHVKAALQLLVRGAICQLRVAFNDSFDLFIDLVSPLVHLVHGLIFDDLQDFVALEDDELLEDFGRGHGVVGYVVGLLDLHTLELTLELLFHLLGVQHLRVLLVIELGL